MISISRKYFMVSSFPISKTISVGVGLGVLLGTKVGVGMDGENGVSVLICVGTSPMLSLLVGDFVNVVERGRLHPAVNNKNKSGRKFFVSIFIIIHLFHYSCETS